MRANLPGDAPVTPPPPLSFSLQLTGDRGTRLNAPPASQTRVQRRQRGHTLRDCFPAIYVVVFLPHPSLPPILSVYGAVFPAM
ncbi:hypothetical protein FKM82_029219 [Ascaphus truei]